MIRQYFLILIYLLPITITESLFAQNVLPSVYDIKTDTSFEEVLDDSYYQMLEDKEGKWSIEDVARSTLSDKFHYRNVKLQSVDTMVHTYWFRYMIRNSLNKKINIALDSWSDQSDFYVFDSVNRYTHYITGSQVQQDKDNKFGQFNIIPIILEPDQKILIYNRIYNKNLGIPKEFRVDFLNAEKFAYKYFPQPEEDTVKRQHKVYW